MKRFTSLCALAACAALLCVGSRASAWGPEGHQVVALIAENNMSSATLAKARALLGVGSLEEVATWADDIKEERPETEGWHFINVPLDAPAIDLARDCANDNCVTAQIGKFTGVLKDGSADPTARQEALKFLIHLVADLHQPLHCEDNNDRGGGQKRVTFFGRPENLHAVWDTGILSRDDPSPESLAAKLESAVSDSNKSQWTQGTPEDWALETHQLAQQIAYANLPQGDLPELGQSYEDVGMPAEETQLEKAGVRLAGIINGSLD